jgi:hypothetical protein
VNWRTTVTGLVLVALPLALIDSPASDEPEGQRLILTSHDGREQGTFMVQGTPIGGLRPGAVKRMKLTVVNPGRSIVRIDRLGGRVVATSRRGCPTSGLQVAGYDGKLPVRVAGQGHTRLAGALVVTMPRNATPKCANTRFTVELFGVGGRSGR